VNGLDGTPGIEFLLCGLGRYHPRRRRSIEDRGAQRDALANRSADFAAEPVLESARRDQTQTHLEARR
jgi:hypothetical protein